MQCSEIVLALPCLQFVIYESQKNTSTLLHTYVMDEYLTAFSSH